jgi:transposase
MKTPAQHAGVTPRSCIETRAATLETVGALHELAAGRLVARKREDAA